MIRIFLSLFLLVLVHNSADLRMPERDELAITWANTKMAGMSLEEKVGQIFMIQAYSNKGPKHLDEIRYFIDNYHIGGLAFFQGSPTQQARVTQEFQDQSKIPLLIAIDAEWGLGMRLDSTLSFPKQMTLGAIQDNRLIYEMGKEIGLQLRSLGVHLNFAPVVDINTIPNNPVINDRSFGQDKKNVSRKAYAYMKGLQDEGIIACAKHFPGHGSTDKDSHETLPTINKTVEEINNEELFPFKLLFKQGVKSVMVGHLHLPVIDARKNRPSSLSKVITHDIIREQLGYEGLILTDALRMKGVADYFKPGEIEVQAFLAGNDILTVSENFIPAFDGVLKAVKSGRISGQRLDESVLRILVSKFEAGLFFPPSIKWNEIKRILNNGKAKALKEDLFRNAITYFKGKHHKLPVLSPASKKIATLSIGSLDPNKFQERISSYSEARHFNLGSYPSGKEFKQILKQLTGFDEVLVSFHGLKKSSTKNFGLNTATINFIRQMQDMVNVHMIVFGSPYSLSMFSESNDIILAYENDEMAQDLAAQAIFGSIDIKGKIPVDGSHYFKVGKGDQLTKLNILAYSIPEAVGLSSDTLGLIRDLVDEMISTGAAPGCQVLVAKDGKIVYDQVFGFHTYEKKRPVKRKDIYDLASVTKIMASTLSTMKLYEEGKIDIFSPISDYVDGYIDTSDKKDLTLIEALTHHAGLKPWIPFYKMTLDTLEDDSVLLSDRFYRRVPEGKYNVQVADDLYITSDYADTISRMIYSSPLREDKEYKYSDLGLFMIRDVIDARAGLPLEKYVQKVFYEPLDLSYTGYNPAERFSTDRIAPTELDDYFRMQHLQGYVHDMGAAMLGGVSGHAGLFSNSKDLAVLMQMLLNKGLYANEKYFDYKTIYTFTTRYHRSSRRGIGFDMKELDDEKTMNMSELAPASTFGHLGFTGTCVFGDPDNNIVYVFLSNRTFPTMYNNKLGIESYRSNIQSLIYRAFVDKI